MVDDSGVRVMSEVRRCPECGGRGRVTVPEEYIDVATLTDLQKRQFLIRGSVAVTCHTCDGRGWVLKETWEL